MDQHIAGENAEEVLITDSPYLSTTKSWEVARDYPVTALEEGTELSWVYEIQVPSKSIFFKNLGGQWVRKFTSPSRGEVNFKCLLSYL